MRTGASFNESNASLFHMKTSALTRSLRAFVCGVQLSINHALYCTVHRNELIPWYCVEVFASFIATNFRRIRGDPFFREDNSVIQTSVFIEFALVLIESDSFLSSALELWSCSSWPWPNTRISALILMHLGMSRIISLLTVFLEKFLQMASCRNLVSYTYTSPHVLQMW